LPAFAQIYGPSSQGKRSAAANKAAAAAPKPAYTPHDLSGIWWGGESATTPTTWSILMGNPVPQMTPLGQKMFGMHHSEGKFSAAGTNDPWYTTCDPMGFPRSSLNEIRAVMFTQTPDRIVEVYQYSRLWREIMTDGRPLPKNVGKPDGPDARWYGYSIGHWEGDNTFVVDTTGSDPRSWLDKAGDPHSVNMMIHETYSRNNHNQMVNKITLTDPDVYTTPFEISTINYKWIPDQQFEEQICIPSEMIAYRSLIGDPAGDGGVAKK
jgi:hypothetical protein